MGPAKAKIPIYLEIGKKRTFAGAVDWPGWCRAGRDEATALDALDSWARRYAKVLRGHAARVRGAGGRVLVRHRRTPEGGRHHRFRRTLDRTEGGRAPPHRCGARAVPLDPARELEIVRRGGRRRSRQAAREGPSGGRTGSAEDRRARGRRGRRLPQDARVEGGPGSEDGRDRPHARRDRGSARDRRSRRSAAGSARRQATAPAVLRPPCGVARPRPRLGDPGPRHMNRSAGTVAR